MNKTKCILIVLIFNIFFNTVSRSQTASVTEGCFPLEVQFFAPVGANTFFWDFMDGATSTLQNPVNTFVEPGIYDVEFKTMAGGPVIGTVSIAVYPKPLLDITADPESGCAPLPVNFSSNETANPNINITNYQWIFGDGGVGNGTAPMHTYNNPGLYTVSLAITTNFPSCNVTEIFPEAVAVSIIPGLGFTTSPNPPVSCNVPFTVSFINTTTNQSNLSFEWDFGNGTTHSGPNPPAVTYTTTGNFTVTLTATDPLGCPGIFTQSISVGDPVADFIIPDTVCIGLEYDMDNNSATGSYFWDFGSTTTPPTSTATNPQNVIFNTPGFQDITLSVVSPDGCSNDKTITIYVDEPDASFVSSPLYSCSEPMTVTFDPNSTVAVDWVWTFGDGNSSTEENPVHDFNNDELTYSQNGELTFYNTLTVTNPSGCTATFTDSIVLNEPNALFMPDVINGCAPLTVTFSDSSTSDAPFVLYEWDYGDGQTATFTDGDPHSHTFTNPGEYPVQLIVTNTNGCTDTSYQLIIEVGDVVTPEFQVDLTEICPGDSVQFTNLTPLDNIDAFHYSTDNFRSFHCFQEPNLNWIFATETGPMDVTFQVEYNGCFSTTTQQDLITVKGPIAKIDYLVNCESPYDITFTDQSMEATNIIWDFGDGNNSATSDLVHAYDTTGAYWVYLTAENNTTGCPASVDSIEIFVKDVQAVITLDTLLCTSIEYMLDASQSIDVEASCWRGYTWHPSFNRPITTQDAVIPQFFPQGDQSLSLVVTDINGCRDTATLDVRVFDASPSFTFSDDRICIPSDVNFTDLSIADTTIVSWSWNFGDGGSSSSQSPMHTFNNPPFVNDSYTISLTIEDAVGCPFNTTQIIQFYEPVSFISSIPFPANLCAGDMIQFNATDFTQEGSSLLFNWNMGNGDTGNNNTITTTYNNGGTYNVTLNIEEIATGCENTSSAIVNVHDYPVADFTSDMDGLPIICYPNNALFMDNSTSAVPLNYQWNFGNGQLATAMNPGASFGKGTFTVEMIASTAFGCSDTTSQTYTIVGPEGDFVLDPNTICKGESITFTMIDTVDISSFSWDFGDGVVIDNVNPITHQYDFIPPSGQTIATLILRSEDDACTVPIEQPVFIQEVIADFTINDGIDTTACVGEAVAFTNTSLNADVFNWDFDNGSNANTENPNNIFTEPGEYQVTLQIESNDFGCQDSITQSVFILESPNTMVIGDSICGGTQATLSVSNPSAGSSYTWLPDNLIESNNNTSITTVPLANGVTFSIEEINGNGCIGTTQVPVTVIPDLNFIAGFDTTVCPGSNLVLPGIVNEFYNYSWNPAIPGCDNCELALLEDIQAAVTYNLFATDILGLGCTAQAQFNILLLEEATAIPNAFTPDGDQMNDHFNVLMSPDLNPEEVIVQFRVWDRWGNMVYDNDTPRTGWDGTYKGRPAAMDSYIYSIKVSIEGCTAVEAVGDVTLIR